MKWLGTLIGLAALIAAMASPVLAVSLVWDAPTTNADGTPLVDLSSYKVYKCSGLVADCSKTKFDQMVANPPAGVTTYLIVLETTDKTFFVTALDTSGNESVESVLLCYSGASKGAGSCRDTVPPSPPGGLRITP